MHPRYFRPIATSERINCEGRDAAKGHRCQCRPMMGEAGRAGKPRTFLNHWYGAHRLTKCFRAVVRNCMRGVLKAGRVYVRCRKAQSFPRSRAFALPPTRHKGRQTRSADVVPVAGRTEGLIERQVAAWPRPSGLAFSFEAMIRSGRIPRGAGGRPAAYSRFGGRLPGTSFSTAFGARGACEGRPRTFVAIG